MLQAFGIACILPKQNMLLVPKQMNWIYELAFVWPIVIYKDTKDQEIVLGKLC